MDVYEAVDCTSAETQPDIYYQCIGAELQLHYKYGVKHMARFRQILHNPDGNPENNGKYREWADHTENKIEFWGG